MGAPAAIGSTSFTDRPACRARNLEAQPADAVAPGAGFGSVVAAGDVTGDNIYDLLVGTAEQNAALSTADGPARYHRR